MPEATVHLGPFRLSEPVGSGAEGTVWRGHHSVHRVSVAVKVLTRERARSDLYAQALRDEVLAVAGLEHPNIIRVFDQGVVDDWAAAAAGGRLVAGSPYLVMELATGGNLEQLKGPRPFAEVKGVLLGVLDALAHAHARGVIHRDIKPSNLLVVGEDVGGVAQIKLSDFGLAHVLRGQERSDTIEPPLGTPFYMAPEQFLGRWRDQGPWTDLYAVGCMAYRFLTGEVPFKGDSFRELATAHRDLPVPRLSGPWPRPPKLDSWIQRMLAKRPQERFRRAADAAWALTRLALPTLDRESASPPSDDARTTLVWPGLPEGPPLRPPQPRVLGWADTGPRPPQATPRFAPAVDYWSPPSTMAQLVPTSSVEVEPDRFDRSAVSPMPLDWRRRDPPLPAMSLVGTGLGLHGVRPTALVGRESERERIWSALRAVTERGRPRLLVIHGRAGTGKSRLAQWMCQRAHELGSAVVLTATHGPVNGPGDGLARMVARALGCVGLDYHHAAERVGTWLAELAVSSHYERRALTALIEPRGRRTKVNADNTERSARDTGADAFEFGSAAERYALLRRFLTLVARHRPALLWLDDVDWGPDAIGFCEYLLDEPEGTSPLPVLLLLTARDEAESKRSAVWSRIRDLATHPRGSEVALQRLSPEDHGVLLSKALRLEDHVAERLASMDEGSRGNPLLSVQLVTDWIQRRQLSVSEVGFAPDPDTQPPLAVALDRMWLHRLEHTLEGRRFESRLALEQAAALGNSVDLSEWRAACTLAGFAATEAVDIGGLVAQRLATRTETGWAFVHATLRDALERAAVEADRWRDHNERVARTLLPGWERGRPLIAERIGRHWLLAGFPERALEPLLAGALEQEKQTGFRNGHRLLGLRERALDTLSVPRSDARWGFGWVARASLYRHQARYQKALEWGTNAESCARRHDWTGVLPLALYEIGAVHRRRGTPEKAADVFREAVTLLESVGQPHKLASTLLGLAEIDSREGRREEAEAHIRRARSLCEQALDRTGLAECDLALGRLAIAGGDVSTAVQLYQKALKGYHRTGFRSALAETLFGLGELHRVAGNLKHAKRYYREAVVRSPRGSKASYRYKLGLAVALLAARSFRSALPLLEEARETLALMGQSDRLCGVYVGLMTCAADRDDWRTWDQYLAQAHALLGRTPIPDPSIAHIAELAGRLAHRKGRHQRARAAYRLAKRIWSAGDRDDRVKAVDRILTRLSKERPADTSETE